MKEERNTVLVLCRPMSSASPVGVNSLLQQSLPTPSPFSVSVTSTTWSSRPPVQVLHLILRFLTLLFSFVAALSQAATRPKVNDNDGHTKFYDHSELVYSFTVNILVSIYTAYHLFKSVCDMSHRGILISDKTSDYISFIVDQLAGYLLISSASVTILVIQRKDVSDALQKATILSVCMSFAAFLVMVASATLSGYKFCKRFIW